MTILPDDLLGKPLQHLLVRYVAHKVLPFLLVDDTDMGTGLQKLIGNTSSDALSTSVTTATLSLKESISADFVGLLDKQS